MAQTFAKHVGTNMRSGDMKAYAEQLIRGRLHDNQLKAARKVTIELSGDAKKYFQLNTDPGHSNSGGVAGFGRKALSWTEGQLHNDIHDTFHPIAAVQDFANFFGG